MGAAPLTAFIFADKLQTTKAKPINDFAFVVCSFAQRLSFLSSDSVAHKSC